MMKYKSIKLNEATDCAAASIATECLFFMAGILRLQNFVILQAPIIKGTTVKGVIDVAEQLGINAKAVRVDRQGLKSRYTLP
jgi:ATP-binding cassette subfamily B protein